MFPQIPPVLQTKIRLHQPLSSSKSKEIPLVHWIIGCYPLASAPGHYQGLRLQLGANYHHY